MKDILCVSFVKLHEWNTNQVLKTAISIIKYER